MLNVTDAERLREVKIPLEQAQSVGIFKDMIETLGPADDDAEPVVADPGVILMRRLFLTSLPRFLTRLLLGYFTVLSLQLTQVVSHSKGAKLTDRERGKIVGNVTQIRDSLFGG